MKKSKVRVTADPAGNVIVPSKNNPEWGHIRLEQDIIAVERGFARKKVMTALIAGLVIDLQAFGYKKNQEIEGAIIAKESLEPFNPKDPKRDYKIAGKTKIVCCIDGQPIYRKTFFEDDVNATDEYILDEEGNIVTHDNVEDIRAAYAEMKEKEGVDKMENL